MKPMHSLLKRQIKREFGDRFSIPVEWQRFIEGINEAYQGFDTDREMLENSLELSSQELLDASSEMRAVFQAIPDLVFRLDHQGILLDIKTGASGELMIGRQDLIGKQIRDSLLKDVAPQFSEAVEQVIANNAQVSFEYSAVLRGLESHYEARLVPLVGKQIVVIIRDITERKQSLRLLGAAVEQSSESIVITDAELDLPGPKIMFVNPAFTRMTGYTAEEAVGRTPRMLQGPKSNRTALRRLRETLGQGATFDGETTNYRKDGTEFNLEWQVAPLRNSIGTITHFLGIQRDVTARKQTENALRDSEALLRIAGRSARLGGWAVDLPEVRLTWSDEVCAIHDVPPGTVPGLEQALSFYVPLSREAVKKAFETCAQHGTPYDLELEIVTAKGRRLWVRSTGEAQWNAANRITRVHGAFQDITERKQTEDKLETSLEEFRTLAEAMPQMVWATRPDGFTIYFSQQWMDYTGLTLEESLGHGWNKPFHPDDQQRAWDAWQQATTASGIYAIECRLRRADGVYRWWLIRGVPMRDASGQILKWFGTCTDIHDLKLAADNIRESEEHFRFLNNLANATRPLAVPEQIIAVTSRLLGEKLGASRCVYADVEKDGERFTILHDYTDGCASTAGNYHLSLFGARTVAKLHRGQTLIIRNVETELLPDEGADMFNAIGIKAIISCSLVKDGGLRALMSVHQTTPRDWTAGEIALVQEVVERCWATIERRTAEEKLRQSEALLRIAGRAGELGGWADDLDGHVTWSDEVYAIHELPPGTMPGLEHALSFYTPQSRETVVKAFDACVRQGTPFDLELELTTAKGRRAWVRLIGEAQRNAAGATTRVQGAFQDITERKLGEARLAESSGLLDAMLENSLDWIYFKDRESRFVRFSKSFLQRFGLTDPAVLLGKTDADMYAADHAQTALADEEEVMRTGRPIVGKLEKETHSDDHVTWAMTTKMPWRDGTGAIVGTFGISSNVTARKEAEDKLVYERDQWRALLDSSPDTIYFKDLQSRFVVASRSKVLKTLEEVPNIRALRVARGLSVDVPELELLTGLTDIDHRDDKDARSFYEDEQHVIRTGTPMLSSVLKRTSPDGTVSWWSATKMPWRDREGKIIGTFGISKDITSLKETEAKLAYERDQLRALLDAVPDAIYFKDEQSRFVLVSRSKLQNALEREPDLRARRTARGLPVDVPEAELLTGLTDFDTFRDDDARLAYEDEQQIIRTGEAIIGKLAMQTFRDGTVGWWLSSKMPWRDRDGKIIGTFGISKDITATKEAEAKLAHEQARFQFVFESMPVGAALARHHPDGRVDRIINDAHLRICGLTREEDQIPGIYWQITHPEDHVRQTELYRQLDENRTGNFSMEKRYVRLDGTVVCVTFFLQRQQNDDGSFDRLSMVVDITELKRAEEKLKQMHRQLLESSRQAGMAEIATNVLHNVGNVLNSVNVSATLLVDQTRSSKSANVGKIAALLQQHKDDLGPYLSNDSKGKKIPDFLSAVAEQMAAEQITTLEELANLRKNIDHIIDIVAMQQKFATGSHLTEMVSLVELVEEALRIDGNMSHSKEFEVAREYQVQPSVNVERHKVVQILINLIRNAKNACAESDQQNKRVTVRITADDQQVQIAIVDNGVGISAENLTRIFNHGFTTRKAGHGFGLHSAALAANELGGSLKVRSDGPGHGATFILVLPNTSDVPLS